MAHKKRCPKCDGTGVITHVRPSLKLVQIQGQIHAVETETLPCETCNGTGWKRK